MRKQLQTKRPGCGICQKVCWSAIISAFICPFFLLWCLGFRVNTTESLPRGVYRISTDKAPIRRGDAVLFCLKAEPFVRLAKERGYLRDGGFCPGRLIPIGKQVYALPGDQIDFDSEGAITVNGQSLSGSVRRQRDSRGRAMPKSALTAGTVPPGKILPLSLHVSGSFDGRYFGLVNLAECRKIKPVWLFDE